MRLISIKIEQSGRPGPFSDGKPIRIHVRIECDSRASTKSAGLVVSDDCGNVALHTESCVALGLNKCLRPGCNYLTFNLPPGVFKPGNYTLRAVGTQPMVRFHYDVIDALVFLVSADNPGPVRYGPSAWLATSSPKICSVELKD